MLTWFLVLTLIVFAVMFFAAVYESGHVSLCSIGLYVVILYFMSVIDLSWIRDHPLTIIFGALGYLICGTLWMFTKWYWKLRAIKAAYNRETGNNQSFDFCELTHRRTFPPKVSEWKYELIFWLSDWPFSLLSSLFTDFLKEIFNTVYNACAKQLQSISDGMFDNAEKQ